MNKTDKTKVACPSCKTLLIWSGDNPNRPFCSESCRNKDFIGWANEEKVMAGSSIYDDILSGQIAAENF